MNTFQKTVLVWTGVAAAVLVSTVAAGTTAKPSERVVGRTPNELAVGAATNSLRRDVPALDRAVTNAGARNDRMLAAEVFEASGSVVAVFNTKGELIQAAKPSKKLVPGSIAAANQHAHGVEASEPRGDDIVATLLVGVPAAKPRVFAALETPVTEPYISETEPVVQSALPLTLVVGLLALVAGSITAISVTRRDKEAADGTEGRDRQVLVEALVALRDVLPSEALIDRAELALSRAGVEAVVADGTQFEASRHHAVDKVATSSEAQHNTVAATERVGFIDRGRVLRLPDVVVYQKS